MKIIIKIESNNNDAFVDDPEAEVRHILNKVMTDVNHGALQLGVSFTQDLRDHNGNVCGQFTFRS